MLCSKTWSEESYINYSVVGALEFAGGYMDVTSFAFAHAKKKNLLFTPKGLLFNIFLQNQFVVLLRPSCDGC